VSPEEPLKVLFVAAEAAPFAKVGGLADVAGALPGALRARGIDARLAIPCYSSAARRAKLRLSNGISKLKAAMGGETISLSEKRAIAGGVPVSLIDIPYYFDRDRVYGYLDDPQRFGAFCLGVISWLKADSWRPDVIHCNDWQTALLPALIRTAHSQDPDFRGTGIVFSIHNLAFQGVMDPGMLHAFGLPWSEFAMDRMEFYGNLNLMKGGVTHADRVSTVSSTYAREILDPEQGHGLHGFLRAHAHKLSGILNGIDTETFNPGTDPHIEAHFGPDNATERARNKQALLLESGLDAREPDMAAPLIGMVARLSDQKGFDILLKSLDALLRRNVRLVILGDGDEDIRAALTSAAVKYDDKLSVRFGFSEPLARRIYAGSDMFLMPSRFEPCGLGQMIAMRYGSVPIVRATGGLADTVSQFDPATLHGNGFVFHDYSPQALCAAVFQAADLYFNNPNAWSTLSNIIMKQDFSWGAPAALYEQLYRDASAQARAQCDIE